jgi:hypothetical protein
MADDDPDRNRFEDIARALADEVNQAVERLAGSEEVDRARRWLEELARSLRVDMPAGDDPLRHTGPHPLDLPTADQGAALAALESGRWKLEPSTSTLGTSGEGSGPDDALGVALELRVRDWITVDGELTLAGRKALSRWLDAT